MCILIGIKKYIINRSIDDKFIIFAHLFHRYRLWCQKTRKSRE